MKIITVLFVTMFCFSAFAQSGKIGDDKIRVERVKKTPEQKSVEQADLAKTKLELSKEVRDKAEKIYLEAYKELAAATDRESLMEVRAKWNSELPKRMKSILSDAQYNKFIRDGELQRLYL